MGLLCAALLWGDSFIGRLDAKADRSTKMLEVRSLSIEDPGMITEVMMHALARSLWRFARFNGCEEIGFNGRASKTVQKVLKTLLPSVSSF